MDALSTKDYPPITKGPYPGENQIIICISAIVPVPKIKAFSSPFRDRGKKKMLKIQLCTPNPKGSN